MIIKIARQFLLFAVVLFLSGCLGYPDTIRPVQDFSIDRYLGKWYEIARLDHSFERGLEKVTAEYSLREDGGINVLNRGFSSAEDEWQQASGRAYFVQQPDTGYLKVSFFGPIYSSYVIFELDRENYQYAFVSGANRSWLWLLSRSPEVDEALKTKFIQTAQDMGFPVEELIFVNQE